MNATAKQLTTEIIDAVEAHWHSRAKSQYLTPGSAKYKTREVEFFVGAMSALAVLDYIASPMWVINILSGRPVSEGGKTEKAKS